MANVTPASNPLKPAPIAEDPQRKLLEQLALLSVDSARDEAAIETEYEQTITAHRQRIAELRAAAAEKRQRNLAAIEEQRAQRFGLIEEKHTADTSTLRQITTKARRAAEDEKAFSDDQVRKQTEQARWLAESVLEAVQTQLEVESRQAKQQLDARLLEIDQQRNSQAAILARFDQQPVAFEPLAGEQVSGSIQQDPDKLYVAEMEKIAAALQRLNNLSTPRLVSGGTPYLVGIVATVLVGAIAGVIAQASMAETLNKILFTSGASVVAIVATVFLTARLNRAARRQIVEVCTPLNQSIDLARRAAEAAFNSAEIRRREREREERRKCAREVDAARDKGKPITVQAAEKRTRTLAEIDQRFQATTTQISEAREQRLAELEQTTSEAIQAAEHAAAHEAARIDADDREHSAIIEKKHTDACDALLQRWNTGLAAISRILGDKDSPPPSPLDWNDPAWEQWESPRQFVPAVPFGSLKIDLRALTPIVPQRLQVPEAFTIPAVLAFPQRGSVLVETDHSSRPAALSIASMVMTRLLTQLPAGRVKFTIIDPVGLGQSFAGFMHLADHDESLVGSRIWTETEHIEQRLADLTEHMETVIQKYLRNEYQTIDQYNAQAGELAEPMRVLVIADFPVGFEQESLRRLASIATSGPRCGVYTIIVRDTRQQLPQGSHFEELVARSIYLRLKDGKTSWIDEVFSKFPLTLDPPADEKTLTSLMDRVGRAARRAKRVEVPFQTIAPRLEDLWTYSSQNELKAFIGKSGATRLQALRLGVGVAQHALIAGKTGSGKSNLMHTIVTNMAMWYSPDEVEFYLIDFKKGVEFKAYVARHLPHARAIAVESDREFGLSVLQRVDAELTRRGELFRAAGVQDISGYRQQSGQRMPRTVLLIDEFQEFFSEDDKLSQEAALLMDRLVRQGRAFGVHVVLGSQTIGGSSGLPRTTIGQMAVRIALQCSETDSQLILGDNNSAARLLSRPGEAIYNDQGGLVEANSPFQIAFLPDEQRDRYLQLVEKNIALHPTPLAAEPVVFEGNAPADIHKNTLLMRLLKSPAWDKTPHAVHAWIGEPVSIKDPTSLVFRRQAGANALLIGQQDEQALAVMSSIMISLSTQHAPDAARFIIMDGTPADSDLAGILQRSSAAVPIPSQIVGYRDVDATLVELAAELDRRNADADAQHPALYLFVYAVQRYRSLRKQEDSFSFSSSEDAAPKIDKLFARLITDGPSLGVHVILWCDTAVTLDRTFDRGILREFDHRVLFQMSATDSSNLIDSPMANKLGSFRALAYSEELGTMEKFRPYALPTPDLLAEFQSALPQPPARP